MHSSRRGITSLTLAVGLGVAVGTSQGVAQADTPDPSTAGDATAASTAQPSGGAQAPPGDTVQEGADPNASALTHRRKPARPVVGGTRIVRHRTDASDDDAPSAASQQTPAAPQQAIGADNPPVGQAAATEEDPDGAAAEVSSADVPATTRAEASRNEADPLTTPADRLRRFTLDRTQHGTAATGAPQPSAAGQAARPEAVSIQSTQAVRPSTQATEALAVPALTVPSPTPVAAALAPATTVIGALADLFGLRSSTSPLAPLQRLLELAFVAVRRTFFNRTPTATASFTFDAETAVAAGQIIGRDPDGDHLTYRIGTPPAQGSVDLQPDGSFTYHPAPGWVHDTGGSVDFTVVVSDASTAPHLHLFSGGHTTKVLVHFDIARVNADPDVTITDAAVQPDGSVKYTVATSDSDRDTVTLATSASNGRLTGGQTTAPNVYTYTYTPDREYAHGLTVGGGTAAGIGEVVFTASDGRGGHGEATATVVIAGVNSAPVMTVHPDGNVYTVDVVDDDGDAISLDTSVIHGTLAGGQTSAGHYTYTFTVDPDYAHGLTQGGATQPGSATVGFVATDGHGGSDDYQDGITVDGTNHAPGIAVTKNDGVYTVTVTDGNPGDAISLTPTVTNGTLVAGPTQTEPGQSTYTFTFTPDPGYAHGLTVGGAAAPGTATVSFVATDGHGGRAAYTDTVTVAGVNSPPALDVLGGTTISTSTGMVDVVVRPSDADGDGVQITGATVPPDQGTVVRTVKNADGTWTITYRANYGQAHPLGPNGSATVPLTVTYSDGHTAAPSTTTIGVTIVGLNRDPRLTTDPEVNRTTGVVTGTTSWTDGDGADTLRDYAATLSDPSKGTVTYNAVTGAYSFTPTTAARDAAAVAGAPIDDLRVLVRFSVADEYGPHTADVAVLIAPPDNQVLRTYASDDDRFPGPVLDGANAVVVSPDGTKIFVSNANSGIITMLNAQTGEVEQTYNIGGTNPGTTSTLDLIVTPSGAADPAVYALGSGSKLWKFDGADDWEVSMVELPSVLEVQHIAVSSDGSTVYFVDGDGHDSRLRSVDAATMTVDAMPITAAPNGQMAVDPRNGNLVIDNGDVDGYTVIDPATGQHIGGGGVPSDVGDFAVVGDTVWVVFDRVGVSDLLVQFTTDQRIQQASFDVDEPDKLVVSSDGERAYVLSNRTVIVYDLRRDATQRELARINVPFNATELAIDPTGTHLYVTSSDPRIGDQVTVISIAPSQPPGEPDGALSA